MESEPEWVEEFGEQEKSRKHRELLERKDREMISADDFVTRAIVAWIVVTLCGLIGWCICLDLWPQLVTQ